MEAANEYTGPTTRLPGYCTQDSAAAAESYCAADSACIGYLTTFDVAWANGKLSPGGVLLVKSPPSAAAYEASVAAGYHPPSSSTFHLKKAAYEPASPS